jgi:hypothetical protein
MLDDLRNSAAQSFEEVSPPEDERAVSAPVQKREPFLGMTPQQRFVLAVMVFMMVCVLGAFFLLLAGKVVIF